MGDIMASLSKISIFLKGLAAGDKKHLLKNHDFKQVSWFLEPDVLGDSGIVSHL